MRPAPALLHDPRIEAYCLAASEGREGGWLGEFVRDILERKLREYRDGNEEEDERCLSTLNDREHARVLAALRNWQMDALNEDLAEAFSGHFEDHEPLTDDEIDVLCERLSFAGGQVVKGAAY